MGDRVPSGTRAESVDEVLELFETWAHDPYDEDVSQLDHALQTAACAEAADAPPELVAAALLHDVGHLLDLAARGHRSAEEHRADDFDDDHERVGARWLSSVFGSEVTGPIALHVQAKRYRCAVDSAYAATLSAGSTASLRRQGGPFTPAEAEVFARHPAAAAAVALREWDDAGKVEGLQVAPLSHFVPLLRSLSRR